MQGSLLGPLDEEALARAARASALEAERKAGKRLGVAPEIVGALSVARWGRGLSDERDARVAAAVDRASEWDPRRIQALRGHVTRVLLEELRPALAEIRGANSATRGAR